MTDISVVIPTFNRASLVPMAIESVLAQTHPAAEIIVVDDGSMDDTPNTLAAFGCRIKTIHQPNSGLSAARNTGIQAATSDWIAFLDDDDEYGKERLAAAATSIRQFPDAQVHAVNTLIMTDSGPSHNLFAMRNMAISQSSRIDRPLSWILKFCFFAQSLVIRKETLLRVGLFRSFPYEDLDLFVRLANSTPWAVDPVTHLHLIRRINSEYSLSGNLRAKRISSYQDLIRIHREALSLSDLDESETKQVRTGLATYLFELGAALTEQGDAGAARTCFLEAAQTFPALHSRLKAAVGAICGRPGLRLMQHLKPRRETMIR